MDTRKQGRTYVHCPKCGQPIRSDERLKNHMARCLATGQWKEARRARS
jgi:RNA polymerase-binding transcription factor DksA